MSRVRRIVLCGLGSEMLTTLLWIAVVIVLGLVEGKASRGTVTSIGAYFSIALGFVGSAFGGYRVGRSSRNAIQDGASVGITASIANVLLTASLGQLGTLASLVFVRCLARVAGGVSGGWIATKSPTRRD